MLKKAFILSVVCGVISGGGIAAPQILSGTAPVNVTSDTAAAAKNIAFDSARRQIVLDTLAPYTDRVRLNEVVKTASADDLANLIAASSIDGEQQSATTYSANITMTLDNTAVRKWLAANDLQNFLAVPGGGNQILVVVNMRNRMADWIILNQMARGENIELNTRSINGAQMTLEIPESSRTGFVAAARASGWQVSSDDGVLRMWK